MNGEGLRESWAVNGEGFWQGWAVNGEGFREGWTVNGEIPLSLLQELKPVVDIL